MFRRVPAFYFKNLTVWGGGTMGGGIAQVAASAGVPTTIVEVTEDRVAFSRKGIETSLSRVAKKKCNGDEAKLKEFVANIMQHITWTTDGPGAASKAEFIIEAIVENMDAKKQLFAALDKVAPNETIFCSNTSSLSITEMATSTSRPERFVGMHFFSPVVMMKLVEVIQTQSANPAVIQKVYDFAKKLGKTPVVATDTEGFIVNRLLVPYQMESCRLVERGVASVADVDTAMKLGCGYPMGPFELSDSVGIDVLKDIIDGWHAKFPNDPLFTPCKLIDEKVKAGKLGKKTGEGFYKYDSAGRKAE